MSENAKKVPVIRVRKHTVFFRTRLKKHPLRVRVVK